MTADRPWTWRTNSPTEYELLRDDDVRAVLWWAKDHPLPATVADAVVRTLNTLERVQ